jgi:hypothetical protein
MPDGGNNTKDDFVDAIAEANKRDGVDSPLFPGPEELLDPTKPEEQEKLLQMAKSMEFTAHYARFDLTHEDDVIRLEDIQTKIVMGQAIMGREEWVHSKEGGTVVVLKWLVAIKKEPKKDV